MIHRFGAAVLALVLLPANAPFDPEAAFGARESIQSIALSPDGSKVAYLAPTSGQGGSLYTVDLTTGSPRLTVAVDGDRQRMGGCNWVSNERMVCTIFAVTDLDGELATITRLVAFNSDGSEVKQLGQSDSVYQLYANLYGGRIIDWLPGEKDEVMMQQAFVPEARPGTRLVRKKEGLGVVRVNTKTLRTSQVESPDNNAAAFMSDGQGTVRIMAMREMRGATGQASQDTNYFYRRPKSSEWEPFGTYNAGTNEGPFPVAVDPKLNVAYVLELKDGRDALFRVALDGSMRRELVVDHEQVDVDGVLRIGRSRRVVGASYATDHREAVFFDGELKQLAAQLSKALPGLPLIHFADASEDERKLLIWVGSDTDPGRYYIYDKDSRQLNEIMLSRPQLEGVKLAQVRPIRYRAADGTMVPGYLTLPPGSDGKGLPAIVMPHGGPSARDEWGFDWLAQYYAHRGFAVLQPNFRGSAGYGEAWFQENGFQSWRTAIGDVNDAGRWLISEGIADPAKLAIVGWSYGGYAALQSAVLDPSLYKAIVAIAPVTDLKLAKDEWYGWMNHANVREFIGAGPHIQQGSPAQNAAAIKAPVLMFHGDRDRNVGVAQSRLMEGKLRAAGSAVELVVYPKLDHSLEDSNARTDMLERSDAFLREALKL